MRSYIILFLIALILTLFLTPMAGRIATALGAIDIPDDKRRVHQKPTPRMGGLAIYAAFLLTLFCVPFLQNEIGQRFNANPRWYLSIVLATTVVFLLGVYDDLRGSSAWLKLAVQVLAAVMLQYFGFGIELVSLPFLGENFVPPMWVGVVLTIVWVVIITNAFNLVDGIDGLAAGISVFALLSILFTAVAAGNFDIGLLAVILLGAVIGFLYFNFYPASIFLGDSGALTLGFMVAVLSLIGAQKGTTTIAIAIPLVSFGLPVVEVFLSLLRRFVGGKPLMQSDRGHIHHRLLDHGLSVRQAAILLYGVCGVFCLFGILLLSPRRSLAALIFSVLGVFIVICAQRLRYPEFELLSSKNRQWDTRRRRQIIAHVSVRQISADIRRATSAAKIFALLNEIFAAYDFYGMTLEINAPLRPPSKNILVSGAEENGWKTVRHSETKAGWGISRGECEIGSLMVADAAWSLRLPLSHQNRNIGVMTLYRKFDSGELLIDLNHICGDIQRELSEALDKWLREAEAEPDAVLPSASLIECQ